MQDPGNSSASGVGRRVVGIRMVAATAAIVLMLCGGIYGYASPYVVLNRLKHAADIRDAQTVSKYVDFPALRASLKQQLAEQLRRRIDRDTHGNPLAMLGAMIGGALLGPVVDAYATPDGVAALLNGLPPRGQPGERPADADRPVPGDGAAPPGTVIPPSTAPDSRPSAPSPLSPSSAARPADNAPNQVPSQAPTQAPTRAPATTAGYRSINEFAVTYPEGLAGASYAAVFRRIHLFSWQLVAVELDGLATP